MPQPNNFDIDAYLKQSDGFDIDAYLAQKEDEPATPPQMPEDENPYLSKIDDALKGAARIPEMAGRSIPILGPAAESLGAMAAGAVVAPMKGQDYWSTVSDIIEGGEKERKAFGEKYPVASGAASILGGAMVPFPSKIVGGEAAKQLVGRLGKGLGNVAVGTAERGGRIGYNSLLSYLDAKARGSDDKEAMAQAKMAGGVSAGFEGLGLLGRGLKAFVPRFGLGVTPRAQKRYKARHEEINALDESRLKDDLDESVAKMREDVEGARLKSTEASKKAETAKLTESFDTAEMVRDAKAALNDARREAAQARQEVMAALRNKQAPDFSEEMRLALDDLAKANSKASSAAFDTLDPNAKVSLKGVKFALSNAINNLKIDGKLPPGARGDGVKRLEQYREYLDELGTSISPLSAKQLVQALDDEVGHLFSQVGYKGQADRAMIDLRSSISDALKADNPTYADAMKPLAESTKLYKEAMEYFSDPARARAATARIGQEKGYEATPIFERLSQKAGADWPAKLREYIEAQRLLKDPKALREHIAKMPTEEAMLGQEKIVDEMSSMMRDPTARAARQASLPEVAESEAAQRALAQQEAAFAPARGLSPASSQQALRRAGSEIAPNIQLRENLRAVGRETGKNFTQGADDLAVKRALEQGFKSGSRNVNLGAMSIGGALGALNRMLFGIDADNAMRGVGAATGAAIDMAGPKMYKFLADLAYSKFGSAVIKGAEEALKRGPQAFMMFNHLQSQLNPGYAKFIENYTRGEQ